MNPAALTDLVRHTAAELGFELVGVASAGPTSHYARFVHWLASSFQGEMHYLERRSGERADPRSLLPEASSVIVLGARYAASKLADQAGEDPSRGRIAAYAWDDDYHEMLKPRLFQLDAAIRHATGRSRPGRAYVDTGPLLERSWATQAGLGFIGKNTCLIAPRLGSWTFLAILLVPEAMAIDSPATVMAGALDDDNPEQGPWWRVGAHGATCGACRRCLDICPTQAFVQPHLLDARRCISYLTIELRGPIPRRLRPAMGNWVFGCDLCQAVCPWNRRYGSPSDLAMPPLPPDTTAPRLLDLLALDETGFRQRFRRSPIRRAGRRGLLRNACVAVGNWGDPGAIPALSEALNDEDALIRGHAAWGLGRIPTAQSRSTLQQRSRHEADPYVVEEIDLALDQMSRPGKP
jgi:epoxyqueuosine reductase